jgi:hypothetical protein
MFEKQKEQKERAAFEAAIENHEQALKDLRVKVDELTIQYNIVRWRQVDELRAKEAADTRGTLTVGGAPVLPMAGTVLLDPPTREEERLRDELSFSMGEVVRLEKKLNDLRRMFADRFNS